MNYNIIGYCIYLLFTFTVIVYVGLACYKHGKTYCFQIFDGDKELTMRTNNILLMCYYLFNLGYCLVTIYNWHALNNWKECLDSVAMKAGAILTGIGILHIINIIALIYFSHRKNILHNKNLSL
ncbi:MAG TPA: hypothetical protein VKT28_20150 [Puia sp.]|nr:hypothetical protein [Puia sp.]